VQANDPVVVTVLAAVDEPCGFGSVDEADCAVMAEQQMLGDVTDRGTSRIGMAAHREKQLVLHGGEPDGVGLLLTPVQEPSQPGAELEQTAVVVIFD
jgi:hypothetical protein